MKNQKKTKLWQALGAVVALSAGQAQATTVTFNTTGAFTTWTVPSTGVYNIVAFGAQGGGGLNNSPVGGKGAEIGGDFTLTSGQVLKIAVGGVGVNGTASGYGGGGGGGSFVVFNTGNAILAIAGGGGGAYTSQGGDGSTSLGGSGGGGTGNVTVGGGGGGFNSTPVFNGDGRGFSGGLAGGLKTYVNSGAGGFGGGGGGGGYGGGGGGGYTGGNGSAPGGFGGFSKNNAEANVINLTGFQSGNGLVTITDVPANAPEPEALSLIGLGVVGGFAAQYRRRRRAGFRS